LCGGDGQGAPIRAVPLAGRWDYRQGIEGGGDWLEDPSAFTFACDGFVLAKCVAMGYAPWREGRACPAEGPRSLCARLSLAPYHQACTRMLRADYCGDGTSFTVAGTLVNAYDVIGVRYDSEDWALEAEWSADGALCISGERVRSPTEPPCLARLAAPGCGDPAHFAQGTLIVSEVLPASP